MHKIRDRLTALSPYFQYILDWQVRTSPISQLLSADHKVARRLQVAHTPQRLYPRKGGKPDGESCLRSPIPAMPNRHVKLITAQTKSTNFLLVASGLRCNLTYHFSTFGNLLKSNRRRWGYVFALWLRAHVNIRPTTTHTIRHGKYITKLNTPLF